MTGGADTDRTEQDTATDKLSFSSEAHQNQTARLLYWALFPLNANIYTRRVIYG